MPSSVGAGTAMKRSKAAVHPVFSISIAPTAAERYWSSGVRAPFNATPWFNKS
jgi:hypothetical protein